LFGVKAVPIDRWTQARNILKQLSKDEAKEQYDTIVLDTADIAVEYVKDYICNKEQVQEIGDIPYGQGYGMYEQEFDKFIREIPKMGYGLVIISHDRDKTFTDENGQEFNKITTTLDKRSHKVVTRAVDIYGYARLITTPDGEKQRKLFLRGTERFEAGSRFKNIKPVIDFSHDALAKAVEEAVLSEANEKNVTAKQEVQNTRAETEKEYGSFKEEKEVFDKYVSKFMSDGLEKAKKDYTAVELEDPEIMADIQNNLKSKVVNIVEEELGKGKKVSEMSESQVDILYLINERIKSELLS